MTHFTPEELARHIVTDNRRIWADDGRVINYHDEPNKPQVLPPDSGAWGHSSTIGGESFVIFSVDIATDDGVTATGKRQALKAFFAEARISYKELLGSWEGKTEISYLIRKSALIEHFRVLGHYLAGQWAILELGACDTLDRRPAALYTYNARNEAWTDAEDIGLFQSVTEVEALASPGYTFDPSTQTYFLARKDTYRFGETGDSFSYPID